MFIRYFCVLFVFWGIAPLPRAIGQGETNRAFLWEAKGSNATVYLAGSVHLLRSADLPYSSLLQQAFDASEQVVFEINLDDAVSLATILATLTKGAYLPPDSIRAHLSDQTYSRLNAYRETNQVTAPDAFRPWLMNQTLSGAELTKAGFSSEFGVDQHFFELAKAKGKQIVALETAVYQIDVLASLPEAGQIDALESFLADPSASVAQSIGLVESWKRADPEALRRQTEEEFARDPESYRALIIERNLNWLPKVESFLQSGATTLVIVGAAHLVGESGLVNMLRLDGYDVEPLPRLPGGLPQPRLSPLAFSGRELRWRAELDPGRSYTVQTTTDLLHWSSVTNIFATNTVQVVATQATPGEPYRFIRLRAPGLR